MPRWNRFPCYFWLSIICDFLERHTILMRSPDRKRPFVNQSHSYHNLSNIPEHFNHLDPARVFPKP
jgi:hypothetical protein